MADTTGLTRKQREALTRTQRSDLREDRVCKQCGGRIKHVWLRFQAVVYPYNPEWPLEFTDAGQFCSRGCLATYLHESEARFITQADKASSGSA